MTFLGEIKRRKVFQVAAVYAVVAWLTIQIVDVVGEPLNLPDWFDTFVIVLFAVGFPIAVILAWAFDVTPEGIVRMEGGEMSAPSSGRNIEYVLIALLVVAVGTLMYREFGPSNIATETDIVLQNSIAVLPFENLSPDPENDYFAAGIHEEILNQLVKLRSLNVIARTSVLQYAGAARPITEIARELSVGTVMEGSVSYADGRVAVSAQLIDAATGVHLWSERYNREFSDVFSIQFDIATNIANALEAEFSVEEQESLQERPTDSIEAYALYLHAISFSSAVNADHLSQAITLDPGFALAYTARAHTYIQNLLGITGANRDQAAEFERLARADAQRALDLDPMLARAHAALAAVHYANWRAAEAEDAFELAYQLSPDAELLREYGRFKRYRGDFDGAIQLQRQGYRLDPNNENLYYQLGLSYRAGGYYGEAEAIFRQLLEMNRTNIVAYLQLGRVAANQGNREEALRNLRLAESLWEGIALNPFRIAQLMVAYSEAGSLNDARRWFDTLQDIGRETPVGDAIWARAYVALGEEEPALLHIRAAVSERTPTDLPTLSEMATGVASDPLMNKPEFRELLGNLWDQSR